MQNSSKELPFLDIILKAENGQIVTNINLKLAYTQNYSASIATTV